MGLLNEILAFILTGSAANGRDDEPCNHTRKPVKRVVKTFHKCKGCGAIYPSLPSEKERRRWCKNHNELAVPVSHPDFNPVYWRKCYWSIWSDGSQTLEYPFE